MPPVTADALIAALNLAPHPEGGLYAETYRNPGHASLIYFMLRSGERSAWHRVAQDELWLFHGGDPLTLRQISPEGQRQEEILGLDPATGARPQRLVPAGHYQSADPVPDGHYGWTLVACVVAPDFRFEDFELVEDGAIAAMFPLQ